MPQIQMPLFPDGTTYLSESLAFQKKEGKVFYYYGHLPVFSHDETDVKSFRMITSQFVVHGVISQADICRNFGVPKITVKRYVKLYREGGASAIFREPKRRGAAVLTPEVLSKAQELFDSGNEISDVSRALGVKHDTLYKAVKSGKLHKKKQYPRRPS